MTSNLCRLVILLATVVCLQAQDACQTPDGRRGTCTDIRSCEPLLNLLRTYRNDPGVVSYLRESVCGYVGDSPVVCCPGVADDGSLVDPNQGPDKVYTLPTLDDNCGMNNGTFTRRVVNGVPAGLGSWPWVVALGFRSKRNPDKPNWLCGGALITSRHVLSAAHCIYGHEDELYLVRVGDLDLDDAVVDGATPIDVPVEKLTIHEEYSPTQHTNDIGLIRMTQDIDFTPLIRPICLPITPELRANSFERNLPFLAGWGATSFRGPSASHLQETQIPVVTNAQCAEAYSRFKSQVIDERVLCAGYAKGGKDACQGDSGGPLMWPQIPPGKSSIFYYLIGVVSYGYKCAEPGYPGVYTRVTEFIPWVESHLN